MRRSPGWFARCKAGSGSSRWKTIAPASASYWRRRTSKSPDYPPRNFSSAPSRSNRSCAIASAMAVAFRRFIPRPIFLIGAKAHRRSLVAGRRCRRFHRSGFQQRRFSRGLRRRTSGRCFARSARSPRNAPGVCSVITSGWSIARWTFICVSLSRGMRGKEFIEVFLTPTELFQIPPAVNAVLGGNIGNRFAIRWRMELFYLIVRLQRRWTLCPRLSLMPKSNASNGAPQARLYIIWGESHAILAVALILSSCAIHQFAPPSRTWTARNGQLSYRGKKTSPHWRSVHSLLQSRRFRIDFQQRPGRHFTSHANRSHFCSRAGPACTHSLVGAASTAAGAGQRVARLAPGNFAQSAKSNCAGE